MQYFTVEAASPREALEKMKRQFGEEARILTHKNFRRGGILGFFTREGVEITGYIPKPEGKKTESRAARDQKQSVEEAKKKILAEARREQTFQQILREIQNLKENIQNPAGTQSYPPGIARIVDIMQGNDFSAGFQQEIIQKIKAEFSLQKLEDISVIQSAVVDWIGERIAIYPPFEPGSEKLKVFIIIGPTGVGKTTTIAKLAAIHGVGNKQRSTRPVRIATIDNYRIAARHQIETYAEIMRIPVSYVESAAEFKKMLALAETSDLVLVDTIGKSPRDLAKLAEMKDILDAAGSDSEIHLAVSATTKSSDVKDILQQFEPFGYQAIILTKLDETLRIGNVIGVLAEAGKPISYIADGQGVPQDIEEASVLRLLMNLDGFRINREHIEQKFGKREKISEKYWS